MPRHEYFCHACKRTFSKSPTPTEYEEGDLACPHCNSDDVREDVGFLSGIIEGDGVRRLMEEVAMRFEDFSFGSIRIDGVTYEHDVVIDRGEIRKRKKKPSKQFQDDFGHTPLSVEEDLPWKCRRLVVGTGAYGRLPVMKEVKREAERRKVELLLVPTTKAIEALRRDADDTNAILHVTC